MSFFRRLTDERGVALPVALAVLFTVAGLATVAARAAIVSQQPVVPRQQRQARRAGRERRPSGGRLPDQPAAAQRDPVRAQGCLRPARSRTAPLQADNWCPPQTEDLGDGASYTFQISVSLDRDHEHGPVRGPAQGRVVRNRERRSPARGGDHQRRAGRPDLPARLRRGGARVHQHEEQRGHLRSPRLERHDHGQEQPRHLRQRHAWTRQDRIDRPEPHPVSRATTRPRPRSRSTSSRSTSRKATPNDNVRLTNMKAGSGTPQDTCSSCNKIAWSSSTKVLTIDNAAYWNPTGNVYLLCRLDFKSGTIQIPSRTTPLFIYIDSPENCGGTTGMGSVVMDGTFTNLYSPAHAIAIMVAGQPHEGHQRRPPDQQRDQPDRHLRAQLDGDHEEQRRVHGRGRGEDARREEQRQLHLARRASTTS